VREDHSKGELDMPMKKHKPEQIETLLRQIEVEIANGKSTPQALKESEITVQTYYRWRKEFGGLKLDQAKRMGTSLDPIDPLPPITTIFMAVTSLCPFAAVRAFRQAKHEARNIESSP
jgi:hypothetical protein